VARLSLPEIALVDIPRARSIARSPPHGLDFVASGTST
jgi:hypothetical protein